MVRSLDSRSRLRSRRPGGSPWHGRRRGTCPRASTGTRNPTWQDPTIPAQPPFPTPGAPGAPAPQGSGVPCTLRRGWWWLGGAVVTALQAGRAARAAARNGGAAAGAVFAGKRATVERAGQSPAPTLIHEIIRGALPPRERGPERAPAHTAPAAHRHSEKRGRRRNVATCVPLAHTPRPPVDHASSRPTDQRVVQRSDGELGVFAVDDDRHLDLGRRDHLDVDALAAEDLEDRRGHARVAPHAESDDGDLRDARVRADLARPDLLPD